MPWDIFLLTFSVGLLYGSVLAVMVLYLLVIARRRSETSERASPFSGTGQVLDNDEVFEADNVTRLHRIDGYY